uniref:Uncharacterized protein n=1 Tax=Steinernema glaseri TaxID=37863 RepID=A0A1I7YU50_9BILA
MGFKECCLEKRNQKMLGTDNLLICDGR